MALPHNIQRASAVLADYGLVSEFADRTMGSDFSGSMDSRCETCPADTRLFAHGIRTACSQATALRTRHLIIATFMASFRTRHETMA